MQSSEILSLFTELFEHTKVTTCNAAHIQTGIGGMVYCTVHCTQSPLELGLRGSSEDTGLVLPGRPVPHTHVQVVAVLGSLDTRGKVKRT